MFFLNFFCCRNSLQFWVVFGSSICYNPHKIMGNNDEAKGADEAALSPLQFLERHKGEMFCCPDEDLLLSEEQQRASHRYSEEQIRKNLERMTFILRAVEQGIPYRPICKTFRVSPHTVQILSEREPTLAATGRQRLARKMRVASHLAVESAIDDILEGKMPPSSKPIASAVWADKSLVLDGEASAIVEHRSAVDPVDLAKRAKAALQRKQIVDIESVKPDSGANET
jgi:hypothetical protein